MGTTYIPLHQTGQSMSLWSFSFLGSSPSCYHKVGIAQLSTMSLNDGVLTGPFRGDASTPSLGGPHAFGHIGRGVTINCIFYVQSWS